MAGAVLLLLTGLAIGFYSDRLYQEQRVRETQVQARILAASVTAALAFDDADAAREYVGALRANPEIEAAAVYDAKGDPVAAYARRGETPVEPSRPGVEGGRLTVTEPVLEGGVRLGAVSLRTVVEPPARRLSRNAGLGLLLVMALLLVGVLVQAHGMMQRANRELEARADELARANRQLLIQIGEREKAEAALRQSQKMEAMGQLTGGVAHDFNNILMVASSGLDLLERTSDPERREMIRSGVRQAVERGASLTRQLLTFSRRSALRPEVVDLADRIEGMRVLLERSLREDIAVTLRFQPGLWPVEVDASQLEVALLNIAVNARDAMPGGGVLTIAAANRPGVAEGELSGDFVELSVTDTGQGIGPETLAHVFEPFFTTKEVGKGTGLGLSQVYGFARGSGGDVRIESVVGRGSCVSILLPRSRAAVPVEPSREAEPQTARGEGVVLLVEDDPGVATMVSAMLNELGYTPVHAGTAADALRELERSPVDLVFSDMVMPGGMDGIDLAREIGRRRPGLPVLLTTGFSPAATAAERDGLPLLLKPYSREALSAALHAALTGEGVSAG
jgi:signal transduction histidine kinase/CheY-like chemotaxis protein